MSVRIKLELYDAKRHGELTDYQLPDATYTSRPAEDIEACREDEARFPVVIVVDERQVAGYFSLHFAGGPEMYGLSSQGRALLRSFSIDKRYRRQGLALKTFDPIFDFMAKKWPGQVESLILAADSANEPAQRLYHKAGFRIIKRGVAGRLGELIIMEKRQTKRK